MASPSEVVEAVAYVQPEVLGAPQWRHIVAAEDYTGHTLICSAKDAITADVVKLGMGLLMAEHGRLVQEASDEYLPPEIRQQALAELRRRLS
ncbi:hypothetical protein MOQ72_34225 [Saccharopolyspora sp. K220]|uniref:hypothetical protein n=1 Tax=Saccharopolyspora soli TaxID=2926618 RepID=UPI001F58FFCA|nr:hypothetical protein [Saccharopolyspora soli]MCI2422497.1 hypothetical protein [Saccharopolyspora soli]